MATGGEVAGHVTSTVREQRGENVAAHWAFRFLFSLGSWFMD